VARHIQVLLLEDRPADAELMVRQLEKAGFHVDWQRVDKEHDFRLRLTPSLDVILADYTLPDMSAVDALSIRAESGLDVPLLVVTGSVGDERAVECLRMGAADYVLKDRLARLGPAVARALADRQARHDQERAEEALRRNEEQLRSILSTVEDVVWSLDLPTGRLLYLNPAAERLTGRPVSEFLDDPQAWLETVHPEDHEKMAKAQEAAIRWGTYESEYRMVRADGEVRTVLVRAWTAYEDQKPVRLEGIFTDVTEKRRAEEQRLALAASREEAARHQQVAAFKSRFLNMVSHELGNVVTPLRLNARILREALEEGATWENGMQAVEHGLRRLSAFLADFLDASRAQAGNLQVSLAPLDLGSVVRDVAATMRAQAEEVGLDLHVDAPDGILVSADARRIEQVVVNLLSNAFKFTPAAGSVRVCVRRGADHAGLTVADTGEGLEEDELERLFQPFVKLSPRPQERHTGTGLGLFISRGIVEQHGGTLTCRSDGHGKGATFEVVLPARGTTRSSARKQAPDAGTGAAPSPT